MKVKIKYILEKNDPWKIIITWKNLALKRTRLEQKHEKIDVKNKNSKTGSFTSPYDQVNHASILLKIQ